MVSLAAISTGVAIIAFSSPFANAASSNYTLTLSNSYSGQSFFDGWYWNESAIDSTTQGNVHYLGQAAAKAANLTYVNSAGHAIVKVDNTTNANPGDTTFGRNSVKLLTNATISLGSLVIMDAVHTPYGCSVWPAFWTLNEKTSTDDNGEIDIFEGFNMDTTNSYTLHTRTGCKQSNSTSLPYANSTVLTTDCDYKQNSNSGCSFKDTRKTSYGNGFATGGGGVYAMLWDSDGIQSWFFPRSSLPSDIGSASPSPASWGPPAAAWPASSCNPNEYFTPQKLVLDITICGLGAGAASIFEQTCSGVCTDLVGTASNYDNAYFEIASIKTFSGAPSEVTSGSLPRNRYSVILVWAFIVTTVSLNCL